MLLGYGWPGNVRELENVVERAVALAEGTLIRVDDLPALPGATRPPPGASADGEQDPLAGRRWRAGSRSPSWSASTSCGCSRPRAATRRAPRSGSGLDRKTLYRKLEEYAASGAHPERRRGESES